MTRAAAVRIDAKARREVNYFKLHRWEWTALQALPAWYVRLFFHLIELSNYRTGHGRTTYAELQVLLLPLQPNTGKRHLTCSFDSLRDAFIRLERAQILVREKQRSIDEGALFFRVYPRVG